MLITYYITAELINAPYSFVLAHGWGIFALFTPIFAYVTWYAKGKGIIALFISVLIMLLMLAFAVIYGIRIRDVIIDLFTAAVLFVKNKSYYSLKLTDNNGKENH